jgi:membrane protease YdiL (CAAX protease family)
MGQTVIRAKRFSSIVFLILLVAAVGGVAASFPLVFSLYADKIAESPIPLPALLGLALLQNSVLMGVIIAVGVWLTAKLGLPGTPLLDDWLSGKGIGERLRVIIQPALMTGFGVGCAVLLLFYLLLQKELPQLPLGKAASMEVWKRLLICFYGGFTEEIMMRIFLFSLLAWIFSKVWRSSDETLAPQVLGAATIILALLFGLGHLASVIPLMPITFNIVLGALLLNGIASVAFTSIYLKRGLEAAILAHFTADLVIWVLGPAFLAR